MKIKKLKNIVKKVFISYRLNKPHATICSNALINAELVGDPYHGLDRLMMYCKRIKKKIINPRPKIKIKKISQSISHIDAN
nr:Ldh family oxidoreductase [Pelagibacterales bacterium]